MPGAHQGVAALVATFGASRVFIISKAGQAMRQKSLHWLEHHDFYATTGLKTSHVFFCRTRAEKSGICVRLGVSCFIDDHVDVLRGMPKVETKILFGHRTVPDLNGKAEEGGIVATPTWEKAVPLVLLEQKANSTAATGVRSTSGKSRISEAHR